MWFLLAAAWAADPAVTVTWRRADTRLVVAGPPGEHVAPEAPFHLELSDGASVLERSGDGAELTTGVDLGDQRGRDLHGLLNLSLCEDAGSRCRIVEVQVNGHVGKEARGSIAWLVSPPEHVEDRLPFPSQVDANAAWTAGVQQATAQHKPLLLDFGAVWCPPCNLMAAEVLLAEDAPLILNDVVVVALDVDDPTSWTLKDRYHVRGYPTVVATDASGKELGRLVGYPGREDTLAWVAGIVHGGVAPTDSAAALWDAVRAGDVPRAEGLLAEAEKTPDRVELHLGRFNLKANAADAQWLSANAPGRAIDWVPGATTLARQDPSVRDAVRHAVTVDAALARSDEAAELLASLAELEEGPASQALYAAAAALMRTRLSDDPRLDKGLYVDLSWLLEHAGQHDEALAVLQRAQKAYPREPTFFTAAGRALLRIGRPADALAAADEALAVSWGDNRLTAAVVKAHALVALERRKEARAFVEQLLGQITPPAALDVRTPRYIAELKAAVGL